MDQPIITTRRHLLAQGGSAAVAGVALAGLLARAAEAQNATPAAAGTPITVACDDTAALNLETFHRLDFEAWNERDWDLFSQIHGETVIVGGFGQRTEGIEDHLAWAHATVAADPDTMVVAHPVGFGAGDWTAVTGVLNDGSMMATIARWENGRIAEEYLFSLDLGA